MTLTVGIDARKIRDDGIGRYLQGLLGGLAGLAGDERYVIFVSPGAEASLPTHLSSSAARERFHPVPCTAGLYSVGELVAFRGAVRRHGIQLLHFPHYPRALLPGCPVAVTIHDAVHLSHPPSPAARLYARLMMGWSARTARLLFTVSEASRADLAGRLGVSADRFRVTPNGVGPLFSPPEPGAVERFRRERELFAPFVLCMATHRPHKNLPAAAEAFRRAGLPGAELIVPARDGAAADRLHRLLGSVSPVRIERSVSDEDLPRLYAAAQVVLAPSLAEGFGLPALEAAACGAAVLATPIPAHREVLGETAAFSASGTVDDLATALREVWNDAQLRARLSAGGPARAASFRWERTARLTLDAYRSAATR